MHMCNTDLFPLSSCTAYAYMELFTYYASEEAGSVQVCAVVAGQLNSSAVIVLKTYPRTATCEFKVHCYTHKYASPILMLLLKCACIML